MSKLLCWLGYHKWTWLLDPTLEAPWTRIVGCARCGKTYSVGGYDK